MVFCFEIGQPDLRSQVRIDVLDYEILLSISPVLSLYLFLSGSYAESTFRKLAMRQNQAVYLCEPKWYIIHLREVNEDVLCACHVFVFPSLHGPADPMPNLCRNIHCTSTGPSEWQQRVTFCTQSLLSPLGGICRPWAELMQWNQCTSPQYDIKGKTSTFLWLSEVTSLHLSRSCA